MGLIFLVLVAIINQNLTENHMPISHSLSALVSHWSEKTLTTARDFSSNNAYTAPPDELQNDEQSVKKLYQTMQNFVAMPNQPQAAALPQKDLNNLPITTIDTRTLTDGQAIEVKGHVKLVPANANLWQKNVHFIIKQSDSVLDCQGAIMSSTDDKITAITIQTPSNETGIRNIQVKNCMVTGYNHGLLIEQQTPANQRYEQLQQGKTTIDKQLEQSPHHILIDNITVTHSKNSGIFLGDHGHNVDFNRVAVVRSGTVGLYFEFGSRDNVVRNSFFSQNGIRQVNVAGVGIGKPNREAIAIDSSANNRIEQSHFDHNGAGGIFLYRNCFEHADDPTQANHFLRTQGSNGNVIRHNVFKREPVGVWIASRQSRNLKGFACGAYTISETPFASYHLDEAEHNHVQQNLFLADKTGIIVEDDNNILQTNQFDKTTEQPIVIGSKIRLESSEGVVKNNQLANNTLIDNQRVDKNPQHSANSMVKFVGDSKSHNSVKP